MARIHAFEILNQYYIDQSYLNITLNHVLSDSKLSRKDKDLCTHIVYGTIQNQLYIEYLLKPFIKGKRVKRKIKTILYMSIYQLEFLTKIPHYAIIDEAVIIAKKENYHAGDFVNAVLRNYLRQPKPTLEGLEPLQRLSIETSHPLWLVKMLVSQYDYKTAKKICIEDNGTPQRMARVNTLKTSVDQILENEDYQKGNLSNVGVLYRHGNIANTKEYQDGLITVQDESSQLVGTLLNPEKGRRVLDMCCAPGSKMTHLSAIMENTGDIEAYDLFAHKIELVKKNCQRLGVNNVHLHVQDALEIDEPEASFDAVLLDAPCSGLGVLKRKPEIKYHPSDAMDEIIVLQRKLLEKAYYLLKNNGKMVYSTCTINKKENEKMIAQFVKKHPNMKVIEEKLILNYQYHSDGFYMCKMIKE